MTTPSGPRDRLIASAIEMVQERGVHATGLSDLLRRSAAARNSIYQHFPGGKSELMVAVTDAASTTAASTIDILAEMSDGPAAVVSGMIAYWVGEMLRTDFGTGCPVAAAALAGPEEPAITAAAARAFLLLRERISASLQAAGTAAESADSFASFSVSAIEGALLQSRALRSVAPLRDVEAELLKRFSAPAC
jgi:TetR/AcrR family transcriptional regulator, lmrAB and yxaGH operons repressor